MTTPRTKRVATLGPAGTNHGHAVARYFGFHRVDYEIVYVTDFIAAIDMLVAGAVDFVVQVCAHPTVAHTIEHDHRRAYVVDAFVCPTLPMGIMTRADVSTPGSIGYMSATAGYFDGARWPRHVHEVSNAEVALGLLEGRYDSGFSTLDLMSRAPGRFRLDLEIGEVDVAWLVYATTRVRQGGLTAWAESPVVALLRD